jgi:hypothetical protein
VPQNPLSPLTQQELDELDGFLMREVAGDEAMTLDILDGYLHAIAIGPVTLIPSSGCRRSGAAVRPSHRQCGIWNS